jgi:hypothetical protein
MGSYSTVLRRDNAERVAARWSSSQSGPLFDRAPPGQCGELFQQLPSPSSL